MKYSIDYNPASGLVSGWVADKSCEDIPSAKITFLGLSGAVYDTPSLAMRPDVKGYGLHPTGHCGFVFNPFDNGFVKGDFIKVKISAEGKNSASKVIILGESEWLSSQFNALEYPRSDFSVMEEPTVEVIRGNPDWLAYKILLIRLRRAKRAKGWRGKFVGFTYEHQQSDWLAFRHIVDVARWSLFSKLSTRYLWSSIDTFADFGDENEGLAAMALSSMLMTERFAQSWHNLYEFTQKQNPVMSGQIEYWGGMATNRFSLDDAFDVFITRLISAAEPFPLVYSFLMETYERMINDERSVIGFNCSESAFFKQASHFYEKRFKSDRARIQAELTEREFALPFVGEWL